MKKRGIIAALLVAVVSCTMIFAGCGKTEQKVTVKWPDAKKITVKADENKAVVGKGIDNLTAEKNKVTFTIEKQGTYKIALHDSKKGAFKLNVKYDNDGVSVSDSRGETIVVIADNL